ncbi:MAG TPA: methyltransferase domain-containing protein [Caulobacteraceae bacterium]|jgi:SAM-dependent methyltransferase
MSDAANANASQITYWNEAAGPIWVAMQDDLDAQLQPLGLAAMNALAPKSGDRVIDVGCGCGATSLALARRVGTEGRVLGVDISEPMLGVARGRAAAQGLARATFVEADAQSRAFDPADAMFSRFGVMFFADPTAAFANIRKALLPAGRLAFVCWQAAANNPWMTAPMAEVAPLLPAPPTPAEPGAPGPFAFADPVRLRGILESAGFKGVVIQPHSQMIGWPDLDTAARVAIRVGPVGAAVREHPQMIDAVSAAVRRTFERHLTDEGVRLESATWIVTASAA